jgi:hypothetical protein
MNKYEVGDTFSIATRKVFVLAGDVIEGNISVGMHIQPNVAGVSPLEIAYVEMLRKKDGKNMLGVCIRYQDDEELKLLDDLGFENSIIEIR